MSASAASDSSVVTEEDDDDAANVPRKSKRPKKQTCFYKNEQQATIIKHEFSGLPRGLVAVYPTHRCGFGLFAIDNIKPNTILTRYNGRRLRPEIYAKRTDKSYGMQCKDFILDASEYEYRRQEVPDFNLKCAQFANHTCSDANAHMVCFEKGVDDDSNVPELWLVSLTYIVQYEQIRFDYGPEYRFDPCLCYSVGCRFRKKRAVQV